MQSTILQHKAYRVNMKLSTLNIAILVLLICFVASYSKAEPAACSKSNKEKNSKEEIQREYIYGMPVSVTTNETVQNGLNSIEINTKSLSSGAYFVTLRTATEHISKLINIIK